MLPTILYSLASVLDTLYTIWDYLVLAWDLIMWGYGCFKIVVYFIYFWITTPIIYVFRILWRIFYFFLIWFLFLYGASEITWGVWAKGNWLEYGSNTGGHTFFGTIRDWRKTRSLGMFTMWTFWEMTRVSGSVFFLIFLICMWFKAPFLGPNNIWGGPWISPYAFRVRDDELAFDLIGRVVAISDPYERARASWFLCKHLVWADTLFYAKFSVTCILESYFDPFIIRWRKMFDGMMPVGWFAEMIFRLRNTGRAQFLMDRFITHIASEHYKNVIKFGWLDKIEPVYDFLHGNRYYEIKLSGVDYALALYKDIIRCRMRDDHVTLNELLDDLSNDFPPGLWRIIVRDWKYHVTSSLSDRFEQLYFYKSYAEPLCTPLDLVWPPWYVSKH